jgi:hypothetical protein
MLAVMLLISVCVCCFLGEFLWYSFPPPDFLAKQYLNAVIDGDLNSVLVWSNGRVAWCRDATQTSAMEDIRQFGNSDVRNVQLEVLGQGGSDRTIRVVRIMFEYRKHSEFAWQTGKTQIITTFDDGGFRYICGKYP